MPAQMRLQRWQFTVKANREALHNSLSGTTVLTDEQVLAVRDLNVRFENDGVVTQAVRHLSLTSTGVKPWPWWANLVRASQ